MNPNFSTSVSVELDFDQDDQFTSRVFEHVAAQDPLKDALSSTAESALRNINSRIQEYQSILDDASNEQKLFPQENRRDFYRVYLEAERSLDLLKEYDISGFLRDQLERKVFLFEEYIFRSNELLVKKIASHYTDTIAKSILSDEDILQAGYVGLFEALRTYDPNDAEFSSHAYKRISGEIVDEIRANAMTIRVPRTKMSKYNNDNASDFDVERIDGIKNMMSYSQPLQLEDGDSNLLETVISDYYRKEQDILEDKDNWHITYHLYFKHLPVDEKLLLLQIPTHTYKEIAYNYDVSEAVVMYRAKEAKEKIKYLSKIRDYVNLHEMTSEEWGSIASSFYEIPKSSYGKVLQFIKTGDSSYILSSTKKTYSRIIDFLDYFDKDLCHTVLSEREVA